MKLMVDHLIGELRNRFDNIADPRNDHNKQYPFVDIAMAAFSAFSCSHRLFLNIKEGSHKTLFSYLDGVTPRRAFASSPRLMSPKPMQPTLQQPGGRAGRLKTKGLTC